MPEFYAVLEWTLESRLLWSPARIHEQLALRILHGRGNGGGMNVHADILFLTHKGAPFSVSMVFDDSQLTAKAGAFSYCV
jgi:hypothetical protein